MFKFPENIFDASMSRYSIKEVETLSGIKAHTLRIWEQRYDLLQPKRTDTNIRYYTDDQLRLILNISTLNRSGFKISRIAEMRPEQISEEVLKVQSTAQEPDFLADSLIHAMLDFDEQRFEKTLNNALLKLGFEDTFSQLVFPFLVRIGVMWQAGSVQVVQEHFISNLIRRKLAAAVDGVCSSPSEHARTFVLFLPEEETHELLLLFTEYILRQRNEKVLYLGASLPMNELEFIANTFKPHAWVTYLTVPSTPEHVQHFLTQVAGLLPTATVIVGGSQMIHYQLPLPKNVSVIGNVQQLKACL